MKTDTINPPKNRTWQTRTTKDGMSYEGTKENNKWYCRSPWGFCGGTKQAQKYMAKYHPSYNIIIEEFTSGLALVLIEMESES